MQFAARDGRFLQEIGNEDFSPDLISVEIHFGFKIRQKRGIAVELKQPCRRKILVIVEKVHNAVLVFVFETIGKLEHFETAQIRHAAFFHVLLDCRHFEFPGSRNVVRHFVRQTFALDQFRQLGHVTRFFDAVGFQIFFADSGTEIIEFLFQRFVVRNFNIMHCFMRQYRLGGNNRPVYRRCQPAAFAFDVQHFVVRGTVHAPRSILMKHFRMMFEREEIRNMLRIDICRLTVEFTPAGVVHNQFARRQFPPLFIQSMNFLEMSGIVHFVADAENCHGRMIAVAQNCFLPRLVVHGEIFLGSLFARFVGKTDFHVNEQTFLVRGFHKFRSWNRAVETNQVEPVFLCLPDIFDRRLLERASRHVRVFMGDDAADVTAQIAGTSVQQNCPVRFGAQFHETETLFDSVRSQFIKNRRVRSPAFQPGGVKPVTERAVFQFLLPDQRAFCRLTRQSPDFRIFQRVRGIGIKDSGIRFAVNVNQTHNDFIPYVYAFSTNSR